jgi:aspartyl protease family protein
MRRVNFAWIGIGILVLAAIALVLRHSSGTVGGIDNSSFASLASGLALLIVIGGYMVASRRFSAAGAFKDATVWLGAMLVLVTLYSYRDDFGALGARVFGELVPGAPIAATNAAGHVTVTLRRDASGHFAARGSVNGTGASFLVDTGASVLTLTPATAAAAGIDTASLKYSVPVETANGRAFMAPTRVDRLEIGPLAFRDVRAYVAPPGALTDNLLGVNILDRLESYAVSGDEMVLTAGG